VENQSNIRVIFQHLLFLFVGSFIFLLVMMPEFISDWIVSKGKTATDQLVLRHFESPIMWSLICLFSFFLTFYSYVSFHKRERHSSKLEVITFVIASLILLVITIYSYQRSFSIWHNYKHNHTITRSYTSFKLAYSPSKGDNHYQVSFEKNTYIMIDASIYKLLQYDVLKNEVIQNNVTYSTPHHKKLNVTFLLDSNNEKADVLSIVY